MTRLTWLTDIHLEFTSGSHRKEFAYKIRSQNPDYVLITGDIANALTIQDILPSLQKRIGAKVFFVLGNHDFYNGSIFEIRRWADDIRTSGLGSDLFWVHGSISRLSAQACIVGVDGWADARYGSPHSSPITLNDWVMIGEMDRANIVNDRKTRIRMLNSLGTEEADTLRPVLAQALAEFNHTYVMTHVPPWKEAAWYDGKPSDEAWLPWFSCKAVGDCIEELSKTAPGRKITVLCGHTHGAGYSRISDDIEVYTGSAQYSLPEIQLNLDIQDDGSYKKSLPVQ